MLERGPWLSPLCCSRLQLQSALSLLSLSRAACAGLAARMSTQMRREREEQRRLQEEEADFERVMSLNLGPMNSLDGEQEVSLDYPPWNAIAHHTDEGLHHTPCCASPHRSTPWPASLWGIAAECGC